MNSQQKLLIKSLSDGRYHSGESLGRVAGVGRAAVWKQLKSLEALGLNVTSHRGRGYIIHGGLALLDEQVIVGLLPPNFRSSLNRLELHWQIESTNQWLLDRVVAGGDTHGVVCMAEQQTAGRGRRGREWLSPFGANLYFSVAWRFAQGIAAMEGLSLAVGVAICRALEQLGFSAAQLKWPNDILVCGKKLAGILLEISGDVSGDCHVVVGVGLNVSMPFGVAEKIGQPWVDLQSLLRADVQQMPHRNTISAAIIEQVLSVLVGYEFKGFQAYRCEWERYSAHIGGDVKLITPRDEIRGVMLGVTDSGGLRMRVDGVERVYLGGELSLRA